MGEFPRLMAILDDREKEKLMDMLEVKKEEAGGSHWIEEQNKEIDYFLAQIQSSRE